MAVPAARGLLALSGAVLGSGIGALGLILWQRLAKNADGTPLFPLVTDPKLFGVALVLATVTGLVAAFESEQTLASSRNRVTHMV